MNSVPDGVDFLSNQKKKVVDELTSGGGDAHWAFLGKREQSGLSISWYLEKTGRT